jgi:hypothetical protein
LFSVVASRPAKSPRDAKAIRGGLDSVKARGSFEFPQTIVKKLPDGFEALCQLGR